MTYSTIRELNGTKETWSIQARLCRVREAADFKNDNAVFALETVFIDGRYPLQLFPILLPLCLHIRLKGDSIQGYVRKNHITRFKSMLKEGEVYAIKNFKVGNASPHYKVVPNDLRIYFNVTTSFVQSAPHQIPSHAFYFVSEDILDKRIGNVTILTDIIGCVVAASPIEIVSTGPKREIQLRNNQNTLMKVTLWGTIASMFDSAPYEAAGTPIIVIITSTTVRKFKGDFSFKSTTATKLYFNLQFPEVDLLSQVEIRIVGFAAGYNGIKPLDQAKGRSVPLAEQVSVNRLTISDLLALEWVDGNEEYFCTFEGEIVEINERYGWSYVSCNHCSKKVVPKNGSFLCTPCNKACLYPRHKYKIHARAQDATGSTTLVIFNDDVERFVKVAASTFMERVGTGDTNMPHEISDNLIGKKFVFKLKVTDYNLKDGLENYTVTRIFELGAAEHKRKVEAGNSGTRGETELWPILPRPVATTSFSPITPQKKPRS